MEEKGNLFKEDVEIPGESQRTGDRWRESSDIHGDEFGKDPPPAASWHQKLRNSRDLRMLASWDRRCLAVALFLLFASAAGVREWLVAVSLPQSWDLLVVFKTSAVRQLFTSANTSYKLLAPPLANEREPSEIVVPPLVTDPRTGRVRKILPEERAELLCGSVWTEYAKFHNLATRDMREKGQTGSHRLAVFKKGRGVFGEGGGLGDTASAHVTVLVFAMLTGRVFQEYWLHHDEVFYSPYINTTYTEKEEYLDMVPESEANTRIVSQDGRAASSASQVPAAGGTLEFILKGAARETGDLNRGPLNRTVEIFDTNKGITHLLWDNEKVAERLASLGLRRETTYGCLSHFLLRATETTREKMQTLVDAMTDPDVFTISLHIRSDYNDQSLQNGGKDEDNTTTFWPPFQCAQEIEKVYLEKGKRVIWYIATDSKRLRDNAAATFGNNPEKRQVLFMPDPPKHISWGAGVGEDGEPCQAFRWNCNNTEFVPRLRSTFVDWYLLSLADFHVVTDSGLGTTAAGRSMLTNTTFKVSSGRWPEPTTMPGEPLCTDGPSPWEAISSTRAAF